MNDKTSSIQGFYKLSPRERLDKVAEFAGLPTDAVTLLENMGNLPPDVADSLVENVIGTFNVPLGVATNMLIDRNDVLIPMATEESSVIAAVSNAAKQCRKSGGFSTAMSGSMMIAQVQLINVTNPEFARLQILERKEEIGDACNEIDPVLVRHGGGFRDLEVRILNGKTGPMVIVHLIVDTRDAMGANAVNSMAEVVAPMISAWTGAKSNLRILSNLADRRLARARATWRLEDIGGEVVRDGIIAAWDFAEVDPYRAATHNKGIMNGVSAVVLATGNDTRAVEAGAHAFACRTGAYRSLTHWEVDSNGDLTGVLELPLAVGLIGGATRSHPTAQVCLDIMGIKTAAQLARNIAAVGLAQNFAALKALATTGIQKGHMALHAKNIAIMAGAQGDEVNLVANELVELGKVRVDLAEDILRRIRP